jgi:hypothetical protein
MFIVKSSNFILRFQIVPLALAALAAVCIGKLRAPLVEQARKVRVKSDVYLVPPPEQTLVMSLGYRSAAADLIYGNVLVAYGLHFQEKRLFEFVGSYLDTINALDPKFRAPYYYADTLLTLQPKAPPISHYVKARAILERGMRELPYDAELWTMAGQFMAYLAPSQLKNAELANEWRLEGARRLARACELAGDNSALPRHCVTAASLFTKAGNRAAALRMLERLLSVSDEPEVREIALGYMRDVLGEGERERANKRRQRFMTGWGQDLSFVSRGAYLLVGPRFDTAACAGFERYAAIECATSFRDLTAAHERTEVEQ